MKNLIIVVSLLAFTTIAFAAPIDFDNLQVASTAFGLAAYEGVPRLMAAYNNKIYFILSEDGSANPSKVYCYDPSDGLSNTANHSILAETTGKFVTLRQINNLLYFSDNLGNVYFYDGTTLTEMSGTPFTDSDYAASIEKFNGLMYFGTSTSNVFRYNGSGYEQVYGVSEDRTQINDMVAWQKDGCLYVSVGPKNICCPPTGYVIRSNSGDASSWETIFQGFWDVSLFMPTPNYLYAGVIDTAYGYGSSVRRSSDGLSFPVINQSSGQYKLAWGSLYYDGIAYVFENLYGEGFGYRVIDENGSVSLVANQNWSLSQAVELNGEVYALAFGSLNQWGSPVPSDVYLITTAAEPPCWQEQAKLLASDGAAGDGFGYSVSIGGDFAIVGVVYDDDNGDKSGSAYIFKWDGTSWLKQQKLLPSDGAASDYFGESVSISGDLAIVGAKGNDDKGDRSGSAYIFKWDGTSWIEQQKLTASDGAAIDYFGVSVSIGGDLAIVGAYGDDSWSGSAYIFKWDGTSWVQQQKLLASDRAANDIFGISVSISGDFAIVGAYQNDDNGFYSGSAYIFKWDGTSWVQKQKLLASDGAAYDYFGVSVSISGDLAIVAAYGDDDNGSDSGSAYIFKWDGTSWLEQQKLLASDGAAYEAFGSSVSISGDLVIVGVAYDDDNGTKSGSAYIFKWDGTSWIEQQKLTASDGAANDYFGVSVSISGDLAIVGARWHDDNGTDSGSAYVFKNICEPAPIRVPLDIKPESCPNPLNVDSKGVLPVAILGTEDFDVNQIDIASIRLEGVAPIRSSYEDVATPVSDGNECDCTTAGPDGYTDLTLKFETEEIVGALGDVNDGDVLPLTLTGVLDEEHCETPIEGKDCIVAVGKFKPFNKGDINKDGKVDNVDFAIMAENWLESSVLED